MTKSERDAFTVAATMSTPKPVIERQPINKEAQTTLQLHTLPREILLEVFRHLLLLPFDHSRVAQEIPLKFRGSTDSARRDNARLVKANPRLNSVTKIRKRIQDANGYTTLQTQVMLVCRIFGHLGRIVLLENRLAELVLPGPMSILDVAKFSLSLWEVPGALRRNSVQLILSISITGVDGGHSEKSRYFCEWRDLHFLVRFVRKVCCFPPGQFHPLVNVDILRTDSPGLCDVKSAAKCLFILPFYASLNGCFGQISHYDYSPWPQPQPEFVEVSIDLRSSSRSDSSVPRRRFIFDRVLLDIVKFVQSNQSTSATPTYQWDFRHANQIWQDRIRRLTKFVRSAHWESREPSNPRTRSNWEALALNTLNEVHDQWPSLKGFMAVGNPTHHVRHFKVQRHLHFLTGMGYLLVSYLPQQAVGALTDKHILSPTQRTVQSSQRSADSLADEALAAFLRITAPPNVVAADPDAERAIAFYCHCALAEACIRVSAALIGKTWCWMYRALRLSCPGNTKEQRAWLRMCMSNARLGVRTLSKFHERSTENRWDVDGALRGEWFRSVIVQDLMIKIGERGPGEGAGGVFEEAMKVDVKEWVARFGEP